MWMGLGAGVAFLLPEPTSYEYVYQCLAFALYLKTPSKSARSLILLSVGVMYALGIAVANVPAAEALQPLPLRPEFMNYVQHPPGPPSTRSPRSPTFELIPRFIATVANHTRDYLNVPTWVRPVRHTLQTPPTHNLSAPWESSEEWEWADTQG